MRRTIFLAILALVLAGALFQLNCSKPLETLSDQDPIQIDTIYIVDTVYVNMPDTSGEQLLCARIASNQHDIVWMFRNPEGTFRLEFEANIGKESPVQEIIIEIDDNKFSWHPVQNKEFAIERDLIQNASIRISTDVPHAYGHAIDICLKINTSP